MEGRNSGRSELIWLALGCVNPPGDANHHFVARNVIHSMELNK